MADGVAAILGTLTVILVLAIWSQITSIAGVNPGAKMTLIVLVIALIAGFVVFDLFSKDR